MKRKITKAMIRELCTICTRNDAGKHFANTSRFWSALEEAGLIAIYRPIHPITGIPYGQDSWSLRITTAGQGAVDSHPELHPA